MAAFNFGGFGGDGGGLGALGLGMGAPRGFEEQYHCYPVSFQVRDKQGDSRSSFFFVTMSLEHRSETRIDERVSVKDTHVSLQPLCGKCKVF